MFKKKIVIVVVGIWVVPNKTHAGAIAGSSHELICQ